MENLTFKIYDQDPDDTRGSEIGYKVVKAIAFLGSKEVGYLKATYIPRQDWDRICPDPIHFMSFFHGWSSKYVLQKGGTRDEFAKSVARAAYGKVNCSFNSEEERETFLQRVNDSYQEKYDDWEKGIVDNPTIDYIHVDEDHRRKGIGTCLYQKMAIYLAVKGMTLKGSGLQQPEAYAVWKKMHSLPDFPTSECGENARGNPKYVLDYRN